VCFLIFLTSGHASCGSWAAFGCKGVGLSRLTSREARRTGVNRPIPSSFFGSGFTPRLGMTGRFDRCIWVPWGSSLKSFAAQYSTSDVLPLPLLGTQRFVDIHEQMSPFDWSAVVLSIACIASRMCLLGSAFWCLSKVPLEGARHRFSGTGVSVCCLVGVRSRRLIPGHLLIVHPFVSVQLGWQCVPATFAAFLVLFPPFSSKALRSSWSRGSQPCGAEVSACVLQVDIAR
jgi:hypothetical protein